MESTKVDVALQATVMAIREVLMEYFKGTCVERLTENSNVSLRTRSNPGSYQYLRRESENQRPATVTINGLSIMEVQRAPERVTFNVKLMTRSPQFRQIYKELKDFMDSYLSGVEVKHSRKEVVYA